MRKSENSETRKFIRRSLEITVDTICEERYVKKKTKF